MADLPQSSSAVRRILLVDADAFFVAVARLVDPEGAGRAPLLIVGGAPGSRGVVCSASYETRKFGVRSAMPISRALRLCPQAMCVPVPGAACGKISRKIAAILGRYSPVVSTASIDEWYLDLTGTERVYRGETLADTAHRLRRMVHEEAGILVSVGGGTARLIAKLAVEVAKPKPDTNADGVYVVAPGDEGAFMERFELGELPHIGPRFRDRLQRYGLRTVRDVLRHDLSQLSRWFGEREAQWLFQRVRGIDSSTVEGHEGRKSLSHVETFAHDIATDQELEAELLRLVVRTAADLRRGDLAARTITVRLRDADFVTRQASRTLPAPVVADRVILAAARELLVKLRRARRTPARLLGVALSGLTEMEVPAQLELFHDGARASDETPRDRALAEAVDRLRAKFGRDAIVPARLSRKRN